MALILIGCSHCNYPNMVSSEVKTLILTVLCEKCQKYFTFNETTPIVEFVDFDRSKAN